MRNCDLHIRHVTRRPAAAQTVQELKYDTWLVYIENFYTLIDGGMVFMAQVSNFMAELGPTLPYKGFFGGGGGTDGGATT